ncbi:uncharacterized protein LOC135220858 [Macrobrachium nipponense]|uniref:uncharacterized protein LOC135220858 n=1 Tax=Macrobrachium nipponense TaxID=159736 RepID=UPI0030C83CC6
MQVPVSPVRPFKIRTKDDKVPIKSTKNSELATSADTFVEGSVRLDERSRPSSPTLINDAKTNRDEVISVLREPSSWRSRRDSHSRSVSRERVRRSRSPADYPGSSQQWPAKIKETAAVGAGGRGIPGRLSEDRGETTSLVTENGTLEPEEGENQEFLASYAEVIDLIRQFNNLSEKTETPASMLPPGIDMAFGLKRDTKVSYELPCSSHAESVLQHVNTKIAGRDNSLRSNRSFKFIPPPMIKQRKYYTTPKVSLLSRQMNPNVVRLRPGLTLDQVKMECPSMTYQEAATLEATASSVFQAASWLDLWSTAVAKIASSEATRKVVDEPLFIRLLQSGSKAIAYLTNVSANVWANILLMRRDAALARLSCNVDLDSLLAMRNGDILESQLLLPEVLLEEAIDRRRMDTNDRLVQQAVRKTSNSQTTPLEGRQQQMSRKKTVRHNIPNRVTRPSSPKRLTHRPFHNRNNRGRGNRGRGRGSRR